MSPIETVPTGFLKNLPHRFDAAGVDACRGGATFESLNPATEELICSCANAQAEDVDKAVAAARAWCGKSQLSGHVRDDTGVRFRRYTVRSEGITSCGHTCNRQPHLRFTGKRCYLIILDPPSFARAIYLSIYLSLVCCFRL